MKPAGRRENPAIVAARAGAGTVCLRTQWAPDTRGARRFARLLALSKLSAQPTPHPLQ
ncbi:hypothetical protein RR42_s3210 [Cupriavidus basilensis]|uniref:Uncharacterized protein n=1 Tax=Cupriavidus basilensis TaxID=68895 RepID=A0A0C4YWB5_9BURK|nr:hypothetical protein RR42_s3210 [Cupriavidus basilensis]